MEVLRQQLGVEAIALEKVAGVDGQGMPSYATAVGIEGRTVREDAVVQVANGDVVRTFITSWIDASQSPLPEDQDRVTFSDATVGIVVEVLQRKTLAGVLEHVRIRAKKGTA